MSQTRKLLRAMRDAQPKTTFGRPAFERLVDPTLRRWAAAEAFGRTQRRTTALNALDEVETR